MTANTHQDSQTSGLLRLIAKQTDEIESISKKIELWTKYKTDYEDLKKLLNNLQDKVRHPYRIPIAGSKLAFVKGHIIHTNEINVLLGYNYFALRSTRQASQIIDRRLANINDTLKMSLDAERKTKDWLKASKERIQEKGEFVEIIETM